jgi:hypothetical protein
VCLQVGLLMIGSAKEFMPGGATLPGNVTTPYIY